MKYLGIDYGAKNVGIAISPDGKIALPRASIRNDERLFTALHELISREKIERVVIGDTRSESGAPNTLTQHADVFIAQLRVETGLPVEASFEAWSSQEAARFAPKGQLHNDAAAAAIILQRYLDMKINSVQ